MASVKKDIKKSILLRVRMLYIVFLAIGIAIAGKILYIQYGPEGSELREKAEKISFERATIPADRGDILSRDGRILATSVPEYEVRMDFGAQGLTYSLFYRNVDSLSYYLARFFGNKSAAAYKQTLTEAFKERSKNRYKLISPRRIDHLEYKEVSRFPLFRLGRNRSGFIAEPVNRRIRPHGSMAARTIGMTNESGTKVGIEGAFDSMLRGTDGNVLMQRISGNFKIQVPDALSVDPVDGIDVVSTIDVEIQDVAETALRQQLLAAGADWGTAILMEVATGEIRAIANLTRKDDAVVEDFNYAIGMGLNPGSTFKLASLITLIDDAGASMEEKYDTGNGTMRIGSATVVDTHGYGELTLSGVFEKSSNIGFALAVNKYYKDQPEKFVDNIYKMGMAEPMHLQIPGESAPLIRKPDDRWWDGMSLTMMSYGYALEITPLKTLTLYNAVANKGTMVAPMFVSEIKQYGRTLERYRPRVIVDKIAKPETIAIVDKAMQGVVDEGTARILHSPYYSVAAKTGTAQIPQGRYGYRDAQGRRHYLASIVGYFPAENPKYTLIVAVKTVEGRTYYGASLAGPVFKAIADRVYARSIEWQTTIAGNDEKSKETPHLKPGHTPEVQRVARVMDFKPDVPQKAEWFNETIVEAAPDSMITTLSAIDPTSGTVPSVVGMGLKEALYILEKEGLTVAFEGRGAVKAQSVQAGTPAERGALITLRLGL